jgi:CheY-like chemotaxis protein
MRRTVEPPDARRLLLENETCTVVARTRLDAANGVIDVGAEASNGNSGASTRPPAFRPTVILLDIRMLKLDGAQGARRILAADETATGRCHRLFPMRDQHGMKRRRRWFGPNR